MKILNYGSLNIDYVYTVTHFVRAGETISSQDMKIFCGGKGLNQSVAIANAGAVVYHAGKTGQGGAILRARLEDAGADITYVRKSEGTSGHAIIQVDPKGQNCILLYGGTNKEITKPEIDETLTNFGSEDLVLLQNETNNTEYIINKAFEKGMRIAFNLSPITDNLLSLPLSKVTYFMINEIEGEAISGESESDKIAEKILQLFPKSKVVLTLGKNGVLYRDGELSYRHGIFDFPVVDTTAAGDTFTGYFLACLSANRSIPEALRVASMASSISVSRVGASDSIPKLNDVETALKTAK